MESFLKKWLPSSFLLFAVILTEGFSSISVEILSIRQLLPFAGSNVTVTSLVIGVFLLFLALGYEYGGRVKGNLTGVLQRNFFLSAVWIGIGLSYVSIESFFQLIQKFIGTGIAWPLMAWLLLVMAPPVFWLGQTLPVTINMIRQAKHAGAAGRIAGKSLAISTAGSFLGALLTTLVLMYFFGVAWTLFTVFLLLTLLGLIMSRTVAGFFVCLGISTLVGCGVYILSVLYEQNRFVLTTQNADYEVLTEKNSTLENGSRMLVINHSAASFLSNTGDVFPYVKIIKHLLMQDLGLQSADILVLGAGGFTLSMGETANNHFTFVDIDRKIKKAVEPAFVEKVKGTFIVDDARHFLLSTDRKFDVIVTDVYSRKTEIPASLTTLEFMQLIRSHLKKDGHAVFNVIASPFFDDPWSSRINHTIQAGCGPCIVQPVQYHSGATNLIYACGKNSMHFPAKDAFYTDNYNHAGFDQNNG